VGGAGRYTWSLSGGALPPGVSLTAAGDLAGTPTRQGNYAFGITAADASDPSRFSTRTFVLPVAPPPNRPPVVTVSVPPGAVAVGSPVALVAAATDVDGFVARVDFLVNGVLAGSATSAPFEIIWTARDSGPHAVTAIATDDAGAWAESNVASLQVTAEIVLYAGDVRTMRGNYQLVPDATAAGGQRLWNPNKGAARLAASAAPANFAEFTFYAEAGRAYRIWIRGKADQNAWPNDSAYLQFSGTVDAFGVPTYRIGTAGYTWYSLEEGANAGVSGWGWQDNGFGVGVVGPHLYFERTGAQTLRIQQREDGLSIDQIVISPVRYLTASPGSGKDDGTIVSR